MNRMGHLIAKNPYQNVFIYDAPQAAHLESSAAPFMSSGRKTPDSEKVNTDQIHFAAMSASSADFGGRQAA